MNTKEKKQKRALDKVIKQSFNYHEKIQSDRERETIENMMKWNVEHLSPNGCKKAFNRTQDEQPKPKRHSRWLTKSNEE